MGLVAGCAGLGSVPAKSRSSLALRLIGRTWPDLTICQSSVPCTVTGARTWTEAGLSTTVIPLRPTGLSTRPVELFANCGLYYRHDRHRWPPRAREPLRRDIRRARRSVEPAVPGRSRRRPTAGARACHLSAHTWTTSGSTSATTRLTWCQPMSRYPSPRTRSIHPNEGRVQREVDEGRRSARCSNGCLPRSCSPSHNSSTCSAFLPGQGSSAKDVCPRIPPAHSRRWHRAPPGACTWWPGRHAAS